MLRKKSIRVKPPEFWKQRNSGAGALCLLPLSLGYSFASFFLQKLIKPWRSNTPVICVGNAVVGGAGKTPVALSLGKYLIDHGIRVSYLSRGYGGTKGGPYNIDAFSDNPIMVGDEALLLAKVAPTWISKNKISGIKASLINKPNLILMDDGLQNHSIYKTFSILVVDGYSGFGNGMVFPSGPLREPVTRVLKRVNVVVIIGRDRFGIKGQLLKMDQSVEILNADIVPLPAAMNLKDKPIVAFSGIGCPEKFFLTLDEFGFETIFKKGFPDHHYYSIKELSKLRKQAEKSGAILVTTEKDWVRLPNEQKKGINYIETTLNWKDQDALASILKNLVKLGER